MTYSTVMVHMDVGSANDAVLRVAATFAERFKASVIGIAACQPVPVMYSDGCTSGDMIQADLVELAKETAEAEASFRAALHGRTVGLTWRSITGRVPLADYIAQEARAADIIITGPDLGWSALDASRRVAVSDVVLHAGRPVLIVPSKAEELSLENVVVGWTDTREARRAITDALPLLKRATRVSVVEIAAADADDVAAAQGRLVDVVAWLGRHGVVSEPIAAVSIGDDAAQLQAIAEDKRAGVMVAGAYGHNRLREWVLGGVTRDILVRPARCSLVSH